MWEFFSTDDEPFHPDLELELWANPEDDELFLVYADWLLDRGIPRGELIRLDYDLARVQDATDRAALELRRQELLREHPELGPAQLMKVLDQARAAWEELPDWRQRDQTLGFLRWRNGFIQQVRFEARMEEPVGLLEELLTHPAARFLQELTVGEVGSGFSYAALAEALTLYGSPSLRRLHLADARHADLEWMPLEDLSGLWAELPRLETLVLRGTRMHLGDRLPCNQMKELQLISCSLVQENVASVTQHIWPKLERLHLYLGDPERLPLHYASGQEVGVEHLAALLSGEAVPALRHLGLMNTVLSDEIVAALVDAPVLGQLETLDLSLGTMSGEGAQHMRQHRVAFQHLREIHVAENSIPQRDFAELQVALPAVRGDRQKSPDHRYVSFWE
jgi:uncharacterized protein (TIGR02996 family)